MSNEQLAMSNAKAGGKGRKFVLAFFIFLFSLFICIACENILEPPKTENAAVKDAGMGYFSLTLGGTGRTIMPETMNDGFEAYTLEFFEEGNTTRAFDPVERTYGTLTDPVTLNVGTWDLVVTAYTDGEKTKAVAQGKLPGIIINTGQTVNRDITLRPFNDGGTGTFSWDIDYPSNITDASMTITRMPVTDETEQLAVTFSFTGGANPKLKTDFHDLETGYYRVAFKLKNNDGLNAERWETLHIYQNMVSVFKDTLNPSSPYDIEDFGARAVISIFNIDNTADWNAAVTDIANGGNDKNYVINVVGEVFVEGTYAYSFGYASNIKVSLRGKDGILSLSSNGNILRIGNNQTVILWDAKLRGRGPDETNDNSLVYVNGGTFTMWSGEISGNTTASFGGGVAVYNGIFTMINGEISGNTTDGFGSGVAVYNGIFTMINGEISRNTGSNYGGGVYVYIGTFTMWSGEISSNTATDRGGGVYNSGTFTMHDGIISGNTSNYNGGGVYNSGTFTMHGGGISDNTAPMYGGGVYAGGSTFDMYGGEISLNNSFWGGGGVFVWDGTFTMHDGKISVNTTTHSGGGVGVGWDGTFTMDGGEIFGNTASDNGGGVLVHDGGTFRMVEGTIYGSDETDDDLKNTAGSGAALYYSSDYGTAQVGTFVGDTWIWIGHLYTTDDTIQVEDGELDGIIKPADNYVFNAENPADWNSAIKSIATYGDGKDLIINVAGDFPVTGGTTDTFGIASGFNVTIKGGDVKHTVSLSSNGSLFTVGSEVTLTLDDNITLQGRSDNDASLVRVNSGGSLVMKTGSQITSNTTTSNGGGVYVNGGTFTMHGGEISGNSSTGSGGGVYMDSGTFRIVTGIIYGSDEATDIANTAPNFGAALCLLTGGTAEFGTFDGTTWIRSGDLGTIDVTILVEDGELKSIAEPVGGNAIALVENEWIDGTLTAGSSVDWYKFTVTGGTTYYVWWNDRYEGDEEKTGDVDVIAMYSDSRLLGSGGAVDSGWETAQSFTASKDDTVYIRVRPYNAGDGFIGTYAIVYSTSSTRPAVP